MKTHQKALPPTFSFKQKSKGLLFPFLNWSNHGQSHQMLILSRLLKEMFQSLLKVVLTRYPRVPSLY